ncbi:MAG: helix-turn-helix transcriptional regulator [Nocardioides sp.]|uniref:helix-turn-helix domain-containing protein n=1 Tax=Nocardioides sp. TaxID=35761 RepID=UPI0039E70C0A
MPDSDPIARRRAFGIRVRSLRTPLGLSQEGLGQVADLDRTYIGGIERGERNVSLDNIWKLADALGVEPGELFAEENSA